MARPKEGTIRLVAWPRGLILMSSLVQGYEEAGTDMAQLLTKKESAAKARSMSPEVAKALARLSSGLYVVTAGTEGTAKGAMVASWVAQASFEPLGLSIAVAKDRAIESLMQVSTGSALRYSALSCCFTKGQSLVLLNFLVVICRASMSIDELLERPSPHMIKSALRIWCFVQYW